jgi:uncharacterized protein (TIGR03083 family)
MTPPAPDSSDLGTLWSAAQARVLALVESLDEDDLARRVPATPDWTVKDLFAHMTGVGASALDGDVHPESEEWTAGHVRERSDISARAVADEWLRIGPQIEELARSAPREDAVGLVADVVIHEQDLRGAVGEPGARDDEGMRVTADFLAAGLGQKLAGAGLDPLRLEADGWSATAGEGEPAARVRGSVFELVRTITGRRSAAQASRLEWDGNPEPYLAELSLFGSLRESDLVE